MKNLEFGQKLEERTQKFFEEIILLCQNVPRNPVNDEIVRQLTRAGGSVAANYIEANEATSRKDFFYKIRVCRKESKEARFWLKSFRKANPQLVSQTEPLVKEATEFILIFSKIIETGQRPKLRN